MGFFKNFFKSEVEKLQEAAESGDVNAMNTLGFKYEHGEFDGILQYDLAYKWYKMAADQGDAVGINNVGWCYENGYGVAKNLEEARKLYEKAYKLGDWHGAGNLSSIYMSGKGVPADPSKALPYMQFAAKVGEPHSCYNLGTFYLTGQYVEKDVDKANQLIKAAAKAGHPDAIQILQEANGDLHNLQFSVNSTQDIINEYNQGDIENALNDAISLGEQGIADGFFLFAQMIMNFIGNGGFINAHDKDGRKVLVVLPEGKEPQNVTRDEMKAVRLPESINDKDLNDLVGNYVKKAANMGHKGAQNWLEQNKESI